MKFDHKRFLLFMLVFVFIAGFSISSMALTCEECRASCRLIFEECILNPELTEAQCRALQQACIQIDCGAVCNL